jgi:hypothetical protein
MFRLQAPGRHNGAFWKGKEANLNFESGLQALLHAHKYAIVLVNPQPHKERAFLPGLNAGVSSAKMR